MKPRSSERSGSAPYAAFTSGTSRDAESALEPSFRLRELSYAAGEIGKRAVDATSLHPEARRRLGASAGATAEVAAAYASLRSIWFRNSDRGAAALAVATYVAQLASVQHAFWVVLGTLSVLRSNALATGATVISALAGTAVGIVVGVALILAIGTDALVLWAVLPVAVLIAAYAPRAISFAAGQAAFTVVVLVLFNLIKPTGWTVGLLRVEDVAIGFAVSIGTGALFWPRGAAAVVRRSLAERGQHRCPRCRSRPDGSGGRIAAGDRIRARRRAPHVALRRCARPRGRGASFVVRRPRRRRRARRAGSAAAQSGRREPLDRAPVRSRGRGRRGTSRASAQRSACCSRAGTSRTSAASSFISSSRPAGLLIPPPT